MPPPIAYEPRFRRGDSRPNPRSIIRLAIRTYRAIEVTRDVDFIHLFQVLDRMREKHQFTLVRQRLEENRWIVALMPRRAVCLQN